MPEWHVPRGLDFTHRRVSLPRDIDSPVAMSEAEQMTDAELARQLQRERGEHLRQVTELSLDAAITSKEQTRACTALVDALIKTGLAVPLLVMVAQQVLHWQQ